ncbi:MAG: hypothetical protein Q9227_001737 [Pyrenula ochraceoflavens]
MDLHFLILMVFAANTSALLHPLFNIATSLQPLSNGIEHLTSYLSYPLNVAFTGLATYSPNLEHAGTSMKPNHLLPGPNFVMQDPNTTKNQDEAYVIGLESADGHDFFLFVDPEDFPKNDLQRLDASEVHDSGNEHRTSDHNYALFVLSLSRYILYSVLMHALLMVLLPRMPRICAELNYTITYCTNSWTLLVLLYLVYYLMGEYELKKGIDLKEAVETKSLNPKSPNDPPQPPQDRTELADPFCDCDGDGDGDDNNDDDDDEDEDEYPMTPNTYNLDSKSQSRVAVSNLRTRTYKRPARRPKHHPSLVTRSLDVPKKRSHNVGEIKGSPVPRSLDMSKKRSHSAVEIKGSPVTHQRLSRASSLPSKFPPASVQKMTPLCIATLPPLSLSDSDQQMSEVVSSSVTNSTSDPGDAAKNSVLELSQPTVNQDAVKAFVSESSQPAVIEDAVKDSVPESSQLAVAEDAVEESIPEPNQPATTEHAAEDVASAPGQPAVSDNAALDSFPCRLCGSPVHYERICPQVNSLIDMSLEQMKLYHKVDLDFLIKKDPDWKRLTKVTSTPGFNPKFTDQGAPLYRFTTPEKRAKEHDKQRKRARRAKLRKMEEAEQVTQANAPSFLSSLPEGG